MGRRCPEVQLVQPALGEQELVPVVNCYGNGPVHLRPQYVGPSVAAPPVTTRILSVGIVRARDDLCNNADRRWRAEEEAHLGSGI